MAEIKYWEKRFADEYIVPEKRERYLLELKGRKHRREIRERLNHSLDYRPETATLLPPPDRTPEGILDLLRRYHIAETCHIIADGNSHDGLELRIERAVEEMLGNVLGFIMICPPTPIAVYKQEDIGDMLLLNNLLK